MQKSTIFPEIKKASINCLILLLGTACLWCQTSQDFEDGDLTFTGSMGWRMEQIPDQHWGLDSLNPISGKYSLHHSFDNSQAGCDYFILHHFPFRRSQPEDEIFSGDSLSFSFRLRHAYPPSSGNNWQLAILSEFDGGIHEGIVVGVNLEGSDDLLKLWRARDGEYEELSVSSLNVQEDISTLVAPCFRLTWQWDGKLRLWYGEDGFRALREIASCTMPDLPEGRAIVIRYEYSAAQDRKLYLDELHLEGSFVADTIAPLIRGWILEGPRILKLSFSEAVECFDSSRISLILPPRSMDSWADQTLYPDSLSVESQSLRLFFPDPIPNRQALTLSVQGIRDRDGNSMGDSLLQIFRNEAEWGDLVFNEVMADPDPPVVFSLGEYVELFNRSQYQLNLEGWYLLLGERKYVLDEAEGALLMEPGDYRVFNPPSLSNQKSILAIYSKEGVLVHAASYRIPYDAPQWKREGGWSLESPDPEQLCNISKLWEYSLDHSGGTPGAVNSVKGERPDKEAPRFLYYGNETKGEIVLYFSETVLLDNDRTGEVVLSPGGYQAIGMEARQAPGKQLICRFPIDISLLSRYTLSLPALSDCSGNLSQDLRLKGGQAKVPVIGSVIINEIMYDPLVGAAEYVELFNPGPYYLDLRELGLDVTGEGEKQDGLLPLSDRSRIMGPGEYIVLTEDVDHLMDSYGLEVSGSWVELEDFKSLPDGGGRIWLCDRSGNGIDVVSYGDELHMELISDSRGISLERINPERSGSDPGNWHSAASIENYATPGRLNSQSLPLSDPGGILVLEPRVFSPDNDGYNDLLVIFPGIEESGSVIRLWITQPDGTPVRMLANNHIAGSSSQYTWDGRHDNGQMAGGGFYVVHLRGYNPTSGSRWNRKGAVGVIYR